MVNEVSVKGEEKAAYIHVATDAKRVRGVIHESYRTSHHLQMHSQSMNSLFGFCLSLSNLYHPSSPVKSAIML